MSVVHRQRTRLLVVMAVSLLLPLLQPIPPSGAAGAVPADGMRTWLRADAISTTADGLSSWDDRSGNGLNAVPPDTAAAPTASSDGANGCPTLQFDGVDDHVSLPMDISPATTPELTIATVIETDIVSGEYRKVYGHDDLGWDRAAGIDPRITNGNFGIFTGDGVQGTLSLPRDLVVANVETWTPEEYRIRSTRTGQNGVRVGVSNESGLNRLWLGSAGDVTHEHWDGTIAEVLVWDRVLTDAEVTDVQAYLAGRYGLGGSTATCGDPDVTAAPDPDALTPGARALERIGGDSRFATAAELARAAFAQADTVLIASGRAFADATAAAGLAGHLDAPILLTEPTRLPAETREVLQELDPQQILVLGGAAAVNDDVVADLQQIAPVDRIAGDSRVATAAAIAQRIPPTAIGAMAGQRTAVVTTARAFADALAVGPLAYREVWPVLLTEPGRLGDDTVQALEALGIQRVLVLGGTAAVSDDVEADLHGVVDTVQRISGDSRFATATAVAETGWTDLGYAADATVLVADGTDFPDALAASSHAGRLGGVLVLVAPDHAPHEVRLWAEEHAEEIGVLRAVGGVAAVSSASVNGLAAVEPRLVVAGPDADPTLLGHFELPPSRGPETALSVHDAGDGGRIIEVLDARGRPQTRVLLDSAGQITDASFADGTKVHLQHTSSGDTIVHFVLADGRIGAATSSIARPRTDTAPPSPAVTDGDGAEFAEYEVIARIFRVRRHATIALTVEGTSSPPTFSGADVARGIGVQLVSCGSAPNVTCTATSDVGLQRGSELLVTVTHEIIIEVGQEQAEQIADQCADAEGGNIDRAMQEGIADLANGAHHIQDVVGAFASLPYAVGKLSGLAQYGASQSRFAPVAEYCEQYATGLAVQAQIDAADVPVRSEIRLDHPFFDLSPATVTSGLYRPFASDHLAGGTVGSAVVTPQPGDLPAGRLCSSDGDPANDAVPWFLPTTDPARFAQAYTCEEGEDPVVEPTGEYLPIRVEDTGTGDNGIYSVRTQSSVESGDLRNCDFRHGSTCGTDHGSQTADITTLVQAGMSIEDATENVCLRFDEGSFRSPPLADGYIANIGETIHTVDDWGSLDIGLCRDIVNG